MTFSLKTLAAMKPYPEAKQFSILSARPGGGTYSSLLAIIIVAGTLNLNSGYSLVEANSSLKLSLCVRY